MKLVIDRNGKKLWQGHVLDVLRSLPTESVNCVVTSPPYFGLRAYQTDPQVWSGDERCAHEWESVRRKLQNGGSGTASTKQISNFGTQLSQEPWEQATCQRCGAWRGELGSEPSADCGRHAASDEMTLRDDLSDDERAYVIGELLRLGVIR